MAFLLHQLLSESASQHPDSPAVLFEEDMITYGELEKETNRLAHELLKRGITKNSRVGIYLNRGIFSVIAACAVLKSGAVYVPIDPLAPLGRIQYIITPFGFPVDPEVNKIYAKSESTMFTSVTSFI